MPANGQNASSKLMSMLRTARIARSLATVCLVLLAASATRATSYRYVGGASPDPTDWFNANNWSPSSGVPGANDDATIDTPNSPVLTGSVSVKNLTLKNQGKITGGTVTVTQTLIMSGGTFINTTVNSSGEMDITAFPGFGFAMLNGATVNSSGPVFLFSGGLSLVQNGTTPAGFHNADKFTIQASAQLLRPGTTNTSQFLNGGEFLVSDPNLTPAATVVAENKTDPFFVNLGALEVQGGTLSFDAKVRNSGIFSITPSSAVITIAPSGFLSLESGFLAGPGLIEINGTCSVGANITAVRFRLKKISGSAATLGLVGTGTGMSTGTLELQGGQIQSLPSGGSVTTQTLNVSGDNIIQGAILNSIVTATMSSGAKITGDGALLNNKGTFSISGNQFIKDSSHGNTSVFNNLNDGIGGIGIIDNLNGQTTFGWDLNNFSSVVTEQGTLIFANGKVTSSNTFTAAANSTIEFNADAEFDAGTKLEGAGLFRATGGGTVNLGGTGIPVSRFEYSSASKIITGPGGIESNVDFNWTNGILQNGSSMLIKPGATLEVTGGTSKTISAATLTNSGMATVTTTARFNVNDGAVINNTGQIDFLSTQGLFYDMGLIPTFNNAGTVNVTGPSASPIFFMPTYIQTGGETHVGTNQFMDFYNGLNLNGGTLEMKNNTTVRSNNNQPLLMKGGIIQTSAFGTVISQGGGINNTGTTLNIGGTGTTGTLNETFGNYTQSANGALNIDINGTTPGTQYDRFNVGDNVTLGGTLNVQLNNGFVPAVGNSFMFLTAGTRTGQFSRINGLNIGNGLRLIPNYSSNSVALVTALVSPSVTVPHLSSVQSQFGNTTVVGSITGAAANTQYSIQFFITDDCQNLSGWVFGQSNVTTGPDGSIGFNIVVPAAFNGGQFVAATLTDVNNNSSNFSPCVQVIAPSNLQFLSPTNFVGEGDGGATIAVTRTGDTSSPATVDYATSDGTADQRTKYAIASGTLSFAAGQTTQTFPVLITDNLYVDGNRTLNINLSSPTGTLVSIGNQNPTVLTIVDNDTQPPATNPLDNADAQFFVRQHYADFLSRTPDQGGFDFWTGQITQCGSDQICLRERRIGVSDAFFYELEYQQTAAYVFRLYRAAFGNNQPFPNPDATDPSVPVAKQTEAKKLPSYSVFSSNRARLIGSANLAQDQIALANLFVTRPEFLAKYPASLTLPQFVDALLANILADSGVDLTAQRNALIALGGRGAVIYRVADDSQQTNPINNRMFIDAEYNRSFVTSQYFGYLRRDADIAGFIFWFGQISSAPLRDVNKQHAMTCSIITSAEYQQRFSSVVTHNNGECPQ